ncbi:MAG: hypothetical protein SV253_10340 [Halobacteria archaeon]|nr:hypothetical protein [Halobacteria archaeon]
MSLAQDCRDVVSRYPYMLDCLREGVVNYRALARKIKPEVEEEVGGDVNIEAVTTALRRYGDELEDGVENVERVRKVLGGSRVSLRGNVVSFTATRVGDLGIESGFFHLVRGRSYTTVVTDDTYADEVREGIEDGEGEVVEERHDLTGIVVESPEEITDVSGVLSYMISRFMSEEINIVDITSCYTETIIVVERDDAVRALDLLETAVDAV